MTAAARILLYSDSGDGGSLQRSLAESGYRATPVTAREAALAAAADGAPDIAIVDSTDAVAGAELATALRQAAAGRPLPAIVISADPPPADQDAALDYLPRGCHQVELTSRLETLGRLVTMQAELSRRAATAGDYGVAGPEPADPPERVTDARVLLLAAPEARVQDLESTLARHAAVRRVEAAHDALAQLLREPFDAVIAVVGRQARPMLDFCIDVRANTRLYNVPVLLAVEASRFGDPAAAYRAGASDLVPRSAGPDRLTLRTLHQVRLQRYRQAMQQLYRAARHHDTSDALTGLFSHGFLHAHLERLIGDAEQAGKALSVGLLSVINLHLINQAHGYVAGDRILRQLGGMLGNLVRAEDLPARLGGHEFCVVLPDTPAAAAAPVLHRIAGVINFTEFAVPRVATPVSVSLQAGCAGLEPGDTAPRLIARARDDVLHEPAGAPAPQQG